MVELVRRVIFELDATSEPPGESEGAWIVGNQAEFGNWTPNTIALLDDGLAPDLLADDDIFTAAFVFDPGTSLEYKYTIGAMGADWAGTEEYAAGNNRGYAVPSDGIRRVRIRDLWGEEPASSAALSSSSRLAVEAAACVFDGSCDRLRETDSSCPSECPGPAGVVYVPPGVFQMGSPADELGRGDTETPHEVTLTRGFFPSRAGSSWTRPR